MMFRYTKRKVGYASRLGNDEMTAVYHDFQRRGATAVNLQFAVFHLFASLLVFLRMRPSLF